MGEAITRHSLRPLRFRRAKLFAPLGRERVAGSRRYVNLRVPPSPNAAGRGVQKGAPLVTLWGCYVGRFRCCARHLGVLHIRLNLPQN